jgi:ABC-type glycerol-3-phosphate transport system substrate-binding protein
VYYGVSKMNKTVVFAVAMILMLAISACAGSTPADSDAGLGASSQNEVNPSPGATGGSLDEEFQNALPISVQLGLGTLLLEDTELAVDPTQAAELLPLWKAARTLSESETVAEAELQAVFNQIEDTMTPEQITFIGEMQLEQEQLTQLLEDLDLPLGFGRGEGFANLTPEQQATAQAARESGQFGPGGGFPGGGFPGGGNPGGGPGGQSFGGGNLTPEQMEARQAERGNVGARFALFFVDPLIELLEARAGE